MVNFIDITVVVWPNGVVVVGAKRLNGVVAGVDVEANRELSVVASELPPKSSAEILRKSR